MCNHFFGKDVKDGDIRSIQRDFEFLVEDTNIPIEQIKMDSKIIKFISLLVINDLMPINK